MIRKLLVILILSLFTTNSFSAGSDSTSSKVKSNYDKAVESIKFAKKYEAKGKLEKATEKVRLPCMRWARSNVPNVRCHSTDRKIRKTETCASSSVHASE